jgi:hypothetical protein
MALPQDWPLVGLNPASIQGRFFIEKESFKPTSIAAGSGSAAETTQITGSETIDVGYIVSWELNGGNAPLTTATDQAVYIAIKGVSGTYYGVAYNQQVNGGIFTMPNADKINIVTANQDTATHTMNGYWHAVKANLLPAYKP